MNKYFKVIALVLVQLASTLFVQAQDFTMSNLSRVAQGTFYNPTLLNDTRVSIGLPILSGIGAGIRNSGFDLQQVAPKRSDTVRLSLLNLATAVGNGNNYTYLNAQADLFHVQVKIGKGYYMLHGRDIVELNTLLPSDFFKLIAFGNAQFARENRAVNLSNFGLDFTYRRELGIGVVYPIDEKWTVAGRVKYLMGLANVNLAQSPSGLYTDSANGYSLTAESKYRLNMSTGDVDINQVLDGKAPNNAAQTILRGFGNGNSGFGVDLGISFRPTDRWQFSGYLNDLGFINYLNSTRRYESQFDRTGFEGLKLSNFIDTDREVKTNQYTDSLKNRFTSKYDNGSYSTALVWNAGLMTNYHFDEDTRAVLLLHARHFNGLQPSASIGIAEKIGRGVEYTINYSVQQNTWNNVGVGYSINAGPIQWYMAMDNVLGAFFPDRAKLLNIRTGINVVFRDPVPKDRDKDGVPDKVDICPDDSGLVQYAGCPDRDRDGIIDRDDACPLTPGLLVFKGCPDTDKDSIPDYQDRCPTVPGKVSLQGCPDQDNDGIADLDDKCPTEPGVAYLAGCPDDDKDTVANAVDRCPQVPGPKEHFGCPDTDKDGIYDDTDKCPTEVGPASNNGCPLPKPVEVVPVPIPIPVDKDSDGDGVLDSKDECPLTPGDPANKGCPVLKKEEQAVINTAFSNLEFETGKDVIVKSSYASLEALAKLLAEHPEFKLRISGHTDNQGKPAANMMLSKKRAQATEKFLTERGAKADRIKSEWFGQTRPVASNKTPQGRKRNRRVEMKVLFD